jgi:hypothetical protein
MKITEKTKLYLNTDKIFGKAWNDIKPPTGNTLIQFRAREVVKVLDVLDDCGIHYLLRHKEATDSLKRIDGAVELMTRRLLGNKRYAMAKVAIEHAVKKGEEK